MMNERVVVFDPERGTLVGAMGEPFTSVEFPGLNEEQARQVRMQIAAHLAQPPYEPAFDLGRATPPFRLYIETPHVMRADVMASRVLAEYLAAHPELYAGKRVLDMGCGCGIQGIVMGLLGAEHVTFTDISPFAYANTTKNVERLGLDGKSTILQGDLFEKMPGAVDFVVFNHPFFPADPDPHMPITSAMLDSGKLIHRFLEQAHAKCRGPVIMPFLELAGGTNDPSVQGPQHGYEASVLVAGQQTQHLQRGPFRINQLVRR